MTVTTMIMIAIVMMRTALTDIVTVFEGLAHMLEATFAMSHPKMPHTHWLKP